MTRSLLRHIGLAITLFGILAPTLASAQTSIPDRYPNLGAGARPLGMGSAFITMPGSDINGQFYNPASADDFHQDWEFEVMDIFGQADSKSYSVFKDLRNMAKDISNSSTTNGKVSAFQTFFNQHVGQFVEIDSRIIPYAMRRKHFTGTVIAEANTVLSMRNPAFPNIQMKGTGDGGIFLSTAWELFEGFQAGVAAKALYRMNIDTTVTTADIIAQSKLQNIIGLKQWNKGIGGGADIGAKYTLPIWDSWAPVLGAVWQDIGDTRFKAFKSQNGGTPSRIKQSVTTAIGVHPELADFRLHIEFSASQLNQDMDFLLKTHGGVELECPRLGIFKLSLRTGVNQGYPTGGATLDFEHVKLTLLAYGEEAGLVKREKGIYHYGAELNFPF
ncbi:MAG: hypothetical protein COV45_08125 [Deltaproteobacteria bacterium CG11_big_fil_rev_8_21_14_0_20_47_16]|nr:MAG: hypothetical protein COV45_08125 [Deltaproteobacteria bacterium CG11_big_fil_rev_8_21_14_0_20_47_16]